MDVYYNIQGLYFDTQHKLYSFTFGYCPILASALLSQSSNAMLPFDINTNTTQYIVIMIRDRSIIIMNRASIY